MDKDLYQTQGKGFSVRPQQEDYQMTHSGTGICMIKLVERINQVLQSSLL